MKVLITASVDVSNKNFKAREYYTSGPRKGQLKAEHFFSTLEEADAWYKSVFDYNNFSYNPTIWERTDDNRWSRISGY